MVLKRRVAVAGLVLFATAPSAAAAQSRAAPVLEADAYLSAGGPARGAASVSFSEETSAIKSLTFDIHRMDIARPAGLKIGAPPAGAHLGYVGFLEGDPEVQTARRKVLLRRRVALGGGRYSLANSQGVRVVLSTRSSGSFISTTFASGVRSATVVLGGRGARVLRLPDRCTTQVFTARFTTVQAQTITDSDTMAARRLRAAGLCGSIPSNPGASRP